MKSVFILWHTHELPSGVDDSKLIGVYESQADAERAKERIGNQSGFAEHLEGFSVDEYMLGEDHWTEGFVTATPKG